jgi:Flp pilus assembly protein TadD
LHSGGHPVEALTVLKDILARRPDDQNTLMAIVSYSREAGDFETALRYAEQLARIAPTDPNVTGLVADLRQQVKKPDPQ